MSKYLVLEISSFFVNLATSMIIYVMAYNTSMPDFPYQLNLPHSILLIFAPFFLFFFFFLSFLLWGFQIYLAHWLKRKDYRFTLILLPSLLVLNILGTRSDPNATLYALIFNALAFALIMSLLLCIPRIQHSKSRAIKEKAKALPSYM